MSKTKHAMASATRATEGLFPLQRTLYDDIQRCWRQAQPYVLQVGQRGGKNVLAEALIASYAGPSYAVAITEGQATANFEAQPNLTRIGERGFRRLLDAGAVGSNALVVIDDAFWITGGEALFWRTVREATPRVLAMSSAGPVPWTCDALVRKYATWEMNPHLPEDSPLLAKKRQLDPVRFLRDFGVPPSTFKPPVEHLAAA